jgi:hypothetical protein
MKTTVRFSSLRGQGCAILQNKRNLFLVSLSLWTDFGDCNERSGEVGDNSPLLGSTPSEAKEVHS